MKPLQLNGATISLNIYKNLLKLNKNIILLFYNTKKLLIRNDLNINRAMEQEQQSRNLPLFAVREFQEEPRRISSDSIEWRTMLGAT